MFDSLEDLVEVSLNLNYKTYPFMENLYDALLAKDEQTVQVNRAELEALLTELTSFLDAVEQTKDDEGNINIHEFDERKYH